LDSYWTPRTVSELVYKSLYKVPKPQEGG